jgi:hypothetical protein
MKNMSKILGIILTVAMLAGLLMMAVPVSAATNGWSELSQPKLTVGTNANIYAVAPDGKTMFVYTGTTGTNSASVNTATSSDMKLWKSTDAGVNWTSVSLLASGSNLINGLPITSLKVSPNYASDSMLIASTTTTLWRSINGGVSWGSFGLPTGMLSGGSIIAGDAITSIDLASDQSIAVGWSGTSYAGGVSVYNTNNLAWTAPGTATWGTGANAVAVAFSPNYANDAAVLTVTDNNTVVALHTAVGSNAWDADVKVGTLGTTATFTSTIITNASIALPSDYDWASSSNKVFVGLGGATTATLNDVYRVNGKLYGTSTVYALGSGVNVYSVAYKGTSGAGTVVVGAIDSPQISSSVNAISATSPDWTVSDMLSSPSSELAAPNVFVSFSPTSNLCYAGSAGVHSNLTSSSDYISFKGFAFIGCSAFTSSNPGLGKYAGAGTPYQFIRVTDTVGDLSYRMLFASTDSGLTWKEILFNGTAAIDSIKYLPATYATDKTIYVTQTTNRILKSTDAGNTWATISAPGNVIVDQIGLVDANTYWVASHTGGNAGVLQGMRRSDSVTTAQIDGQVAVTIVIMPFGIIVPCKNGTIYLSTDSGATFLKLGTDGQFLNGVFPNFTFDVPKKTIYAQENSSKNIMQWVVGTDVAWSTFITDSDLPTNLKGSMYSSITLANGVWYYDKSASSAYAQIWQSVDVTDTNNNDGFIPVTDTVYTAGIGGVLTVPTGSQAAPKDASGNTVLVNVVTRSATPPTGEYPQALMQFTNTIMAAPVSVAPVDKASTEATTVDFSWKAVVGGNIKYDLQIAYDPAFTSLALTNFTTVDPTVYPSASSVSYAQVASTVVAGVVLNPGRQYYWRVRVTSPMVSTWSAGVSFTTKPTSSGTSNVAGLDSVGRLSPANGASGVATTAAITWGAVVGASAYNFKISTDPSFATVVDSKDGLTTTAYVPAKALDAGKTYFWEVQSVSGTATSSWIVSAFTTAAAGTGPGATATGPVITPVITFTVPPAATPTYTFTVPAGGNNTPNSTPGYIWVIIVIGAVLVIAVIVLIVRTRRV